MSFCGCELLDCFLRPNCPMAQKSAGKTDAFTAKFVSGEQVDQNVVVVAGVESDFTSASGFDLRRLVVNKSR